MIVTIDILKVIEALIIIWCIATIAKINRKHKRR